jgi:hypothetical protein
VKAVVAYQKKLLGSGKEIQAKQKEEFTPWMEKQRQQLMHSFSKAKLLYEEQRKAGSVHNSNSAIQALQEASENQRELEVGAEFLQVDVYLIPSTASWAHLSGYYQYRIP